MSTALDRDFAEETLRLIRQRALEEDEPSGLRGYVLGITHRYCCPDRPDGLEDGG